MKTVVFRVDGNRRLGMGHLTRCIKLAQEFEKHKISSHFLIKNYELAKKILRTSNFHFTTFSKNADVKMEISTIKNLYEKMRFNCIFIDQRGYQRKGKGKKFYSEINNLCKTVVIDSIHKSSFEANLIIWPWPMFKQNKRNYIPPSVKNKLLSGSRYMLLGQIPKKNLKIKRCKNSLLISMGGGDKIRFTEKIIKVLKKTKLKFNAFIVIGKFFKNYNEIKNEIGNDKRFNIITDTSSLINLMYKCNIGIFTFGITTYEALCVGLPSIIISHSKENDWYARKLQNENCISYLGYYKSLKLTNIIKEIHYLVNHPEVQKKYAVLGKKIIDGKGIERVSKKMLELMK